VLAHEGPDARELGLDPVRGEADRLDGAVSLGGEERPRRPALDDRRALDRREPGRRLGE
jgi:hypothetical protein